MRALAHPVRLALLDALGVRGPLTATEAGEAIGESPTTCSFHFRQLAKYGFVEEAEGGTGRQRPWRAVHTGMRFTDVQDDPDTALAATTLANVFRERWFARARAGLDQRAAMPEEWRRVTGMDQFTLYVTPDEMKAFNDEMLALCDRFRERLADPSTRPEGSRAIEHVSFYYLVPS